MFLKANFILALFFMIAEKSGVNTQEDEIAELQDTQKYEQIFDSHIQELYYQIGLDEKNLDFEVFSKAMLGYYNLRNENRLNEKQVITIIDYTKPISQRRLYLIDLENKELTLQTLVSHGINSGNEFPTKFSNIYGSYMTSQGFLITGERYHGVFGHSMRLDGVDAGINDRVRARAIVMHPARPVRLRGRTIGIGRSLGCPSIEPRFSRQVIDTIADGTMIFIHTNRNDEFISKSTNLDQMNALKGFLGIT